MYMYIVGVVLSSMAGVDGELAATTLPCGLHSLHKKLWGCINGCHKWDEDDGSSSLPWPGSSSASYYDRCLGSFFLQEKWYGPIA